MIQIQSTIFVCYIIVLLELYLKNCTKAIRYSGKVSFVEYYAIEPKKEIEVNCYK